jgi:hypothetical protein
VRVSLAAALGAALFTRRPEGLRSPFVLHVGTLEPRKNIGTAIAAVAALRERRPDVELVLVGQRGWESSDLFETIARSPFVRYLGHVSDDDLAALYRLAGLLIVPSHYEGFGLTVLEAMVAGTPVVTSGKGSLAEVAGRRGRRSHGRRRGSVRRGDAGGAERRPTARGQGGGGPSAGGPLHLGAGRHGNGRSLRAAARPEVAA